MDPIVAPPRASVKSRLSSVLPHLAQKFKGSSDFSVGFDVTDKAEEEARKKRLARFGHELESNTDAAAADAMEDAMEVTPSADEDQDNGETVKDGLDSTAPTVLNELPTDLPESSGSPRTEALYVYGVNDMSTGEVMKVFQGYNPNHLEWVNDQSCVVVWQDMFAAKRALVALGHTQLERPAMTTEAQSSASDSLSSDTATETECTSRNLITFAAPEPVQWRLMSPLKLSGKQLLLRPASDGDRKRRGAARQSDYYRQHGNPHTGKAGAVSLSDLRARAQKRKRDHGDEPSDTAAAVEEEESAATVATPATPPPPALLHNAHLLIEVQNTGAPKQESDAEEDDTPSAVATAGLVPRSYSGDLQTLTIKVERNSDDDDDNKAAADDDEDADEERRQRRMREEQIAEEEAKLYRHSPSPKRTKRGGSGKEEAERLEQLQKMCITITVDKDAEERERLEHQRDQDRLMEEQRQAILTRRRHRELLGQRPGHLSSVVVKPSSTAQASSAAASADSSSRRPTDDYGDRHEAKGFRSESAHSSAVPSGSDDLRHRLKHRGSSRSGRRDRDRDSFKPPVPGSLTITCDFDDR